HDLHEADCRSTNLADTTIVSAEHPLHGMLDAERIGAKDVALLALFQVAQQRVGAVGQADFADSGKAFVGTQLEEGQVAPGAAHHQHGHVRNLHEVDSGYLLSKQPAS